MLQVPYFKQQTDFTCGPACLRMVFAYYNLELSEEQIKKEAKTIHEPCVGTEISDMESVAKQHKFTTMLKEHATIEELENHIKKQIPVIVNYKNPYTGNGHFAIVIGFNNHSLFLQDPSPDYDGKNVELCKEVFLRSWFSGNRKYTNCALIIEK